MEPPTTCIPLPKRELKRSPVPVSEPSIVTTTSTLPDVTKSESKSVTPDDPKLSSDQKHEPDVSSEPIPVPDSPIIPLEQIPHEPDVSPAAKPTSAKKPQQQRPTRKAKPKPERSSKPSVTSWSDATDTSAVVSSAKPKSTSAARDQMPLFSKVSAVSAGRPGQDKMAPAPAPAGSSSAQTAAGWLLFALVVCKS